MKLRTIPHAAMIELRALFDVIKNGIPDYLLQFAGGIGDELLLTTVAHELKRRRPSIKLWQVSHSVELLINNHDYHKIFSKDHWPLRYSRFLKSKRLELAYAKEIIPRKKELPPSKHILAEICEIAGIKGAIALRPYFFFNDGEVHRGKISKRQVSIQCCNEMSYSTVMKNKLWYQDRFQNVVNELKSDQGEKFEIIQVGGVNDPKLQGVIDLRGKTSLRDTAAILANSDCFIGTVGFLMHLARAVDCRSVIIYGGREHSRQTGYICNENHDSYLNCAPCWLWDDCEYNKKCMTMISSESVYLSVKKVMDRREELLEVETFYL